MIFSRMKERLKTDIFNYEDKDKDRKAIENAILFFLISSIGLVIFALDIIYDFNKYIEVTIGIIMIGFIGEVLVIEKKLMLSSILMSTSYFLLSAILIYSGGNKGSGIIWTFIVPFGVYTVFKFRAGIIINFFILIISIVAFWTPINKYIYNYGIELQVRYPLYMFGAIVFATVKEWISSIGYKNLAKANKSLEKMVYFDSVTGIPNFNKFKKDSLELLLNNKNLKYIIVAIDIQGFKIINDKYGYIFGNEILVNLGDEFKKICNEKECYAREGADRFILLLNYEDNDLLELRIMNINERLKFSTPKHTLRLNYGIYKVEDRNLDTWTLYDRALMAKEISKKNDLLDYSFYNEEIRRKLLSEKFMEESMNSALINKEFVVYYQPKYNLKEERYCGAEALVRWQKSNGVVIPPSEFISFFEKKGFITKIDMYVLKEVCINMSRWIKEGKEPIVISVNISKIDFYKDSILEDIITIVDSYNIPHKYIELEMTETLAAENLKKFCAFSNKCRNAGFLVSMDDFGSGYSSLTMMKDLSVDVIKIDKSMFPDNIYDDNFKKGRVIIEHIINLSKELNMQVVAEGIEDKALVDELRLMNCDMIQGYYYGKPMEYDKLSKLIY